MGERQIEVPDSEDVTRVEVPPEQIIGALRGALEETSYQNMLLQLAMKDVHKREQQLLTRIGELEGRA